jgi:hypothetical protein
MSTEQEATKATKGQIQKDEMGKGSTANSNSQKRARQFDFTSMLQTTIEAARGSSSTHAFISESAYQIGEVSGKSGDEEEKRSESTDRGIDEVS